ncbi:putative transferase [Cucumis melo var. makuwa]|uniref:Putative transferase n=1 Tax=Cucumis melo var. makuwa TaxID=1194695 RepID=A0A5D3DVB0_CUCMM|nr:putative transferase [Cucumis melo var. makuwa]
MPTIRGVLRSPAIQGSNRLSVPNVPRSPSTAFRQGELGSWSFKSKIYDTFYEGYMFPLLVKEKLEFRLVAFICLLIILLLATDCEEARSPFVMKYKTVIHPSELNWIGSGPGPASDDSVELADVDSSVLDELLVTLKK